MTPLRTRCQSAISTFNRLRTEQPLITLMACLALLVMIAQTALSGIPEPFDGAAKVGRIFYDLALGYFAAWTFNVLVVVVPRWHDQARILRTVGGYIQGASGGAQSILQRMAEKTGLPLSEPATRQEVEGLCAVIDPNSDGPMEMFSDGRLVPVTWLAFLWKDADRIERFHELLVPAYLYFDAELVAMLRRAATASYLQQVRLIAAAPVSNTDLAWLAPALHDYSEMCRDIGEYFKVQIGSISKGLGTHSK